jgi:hypothetical protein
VENEATQERMHYAIQDTPGYGDDTDIGKSIDMVLSHVEACNARYDACCFGPCGPIVGDGRSASPCLRVGTRASTSPPPRSSQRTPHPPPFPLAAGLLLLLLLQHAGT